MVEVADTRRAKLVRDLVPELLRRRGIEPAIYIADDSEYDRRLLDKVVEELEEFRASKAPEELADLLEVILALAERAGLSAGGLEAIRAKKATERGTFSKRIVMAMAPVGDVRRALRSDATSVRELLNSAYADHAAAGLNFTAATQDEPFTRRQIQRYEVYVLETDGRLVATISLCDKPPQADVRHIYINKLAVATDLRGHGLGKRLLSFAEQVARDRGIKVLRLDTAIPATKLVTLYSRTGYQVRKTHHWDGKTYESLIMEKILD